MIKKKLYDLLENDEINSTQKFIFDFFLAIIIIISIVLIFLENEKGELSPELLAIDIAINLFFIFEFLARFYVSTDFRKDWKENGIGYAIKNKLSWFFKFSSFIDFLAIIPAVKFFRIFRTLRFIRFIRILRIFKVYRSYKIFRDIDRIFTILKGMKEESRVFYVFLTFTIFFVFIISYVLYMVESDNNTGEFQSFKDTIWYSIKIIGFGDDTPSTKLGKFFSALLLLSNMAIFGFLVSLIVNKIQKIMTAITSGKVGKLSIKNHIVICGYTRSSTIVINDLLKDKKNINNIILITEKELEDDFSGVIYVNADFTELKTLQDVNIKEAKFAIVFSEPRENDRHKDADLRTVMTIFHIEKEAPHVHTIAELNQKENADIILDKIKGDEILFKEYIDAKLISNSIKHKHISNLFYDLINHSEKEIIREANIKKFGFNDTVTVKELKLKFIDMDANLLGFIDENNISHISPKNEVMLNNQHRIIYLKR